MEQPAQGQKHTGNRHQRRVAARASRQGHSPVTKGTQAKAPAREAGGAAPPPTNSSVEPPQPGAAQPPRGMERYYLEIYRNVRGPLFENPRAVVCRAIALTEVTCLCRAGGERDLRVRAARVFDEALTEVAPSNRPASAENWARACALLADISRALSNHTGGEDLPGAFVEAFKRHCGGRGKLEHMRHYAWAELLAAIFLSRDDALRLRAARTLLARTRGDARKVGRERPLEKDPEACEVIADSRAEQEERAAGGQGNAVTGTRGEISWADAYECSGAGPP